MGDVGATVDERAHAVGWFAVVVFAYYYKAVLVGFLGLGPTRVGGKREPERERRHGAAPSDHAGSGAAVGTHYRKHLNDPHPVASWKCHAASILTERQ